jgi:asparaginyl-tRNA synthetase
VEHFFKTPKYLTVSAQLHLEALAHSVSKVWTLSPTFRAEKSETPRHLSEFYMLEAEMSFVKDMSEIMDLVENMLRAAASDLLSSRAGDELLRLRSSPQHPVEVESSQSVDAETLKSRWAALAAGSFRRMTYHAAISHLQNAVSSQGVQFQFPPTIDEGLQSEHERYLASSFGPVFVTDYPAVQKPFYMSPSADGQTSACFDLLVPDLCELVGGSMRIHDPEALKMAMREKGVEGKDLEWYADLRKYGSVPHGGFGLGFDRLVCYLSGVGNLRDVVGFPRWVGRGDC